MSSAGHRPVHVPVMPREVLHWLQLTSGLTVLDGTVGAGGHCQLILSALNETGQLIGFDRDPMMLAIAERTLQPNQNTNFQLVRSSYADAADVLPTLGVTGVDRVLLDLGLSSDQLSDRQRGFGFDAGGPLDMRYHSAEGRPAAEILRSLDEAQLGEIFKTYGEEPASKKIATEIVRRRKLGHPVTTAEELESCVCGAVGTARTAGGRNPATRVFQALRIATNNELQHVERMLTEVLPNILNPGGIAVILTFHSLEDRIVKNTFKGHQGWHVLTKTPIEASPAEIRLNPRSRSAKLRAARWQGNC